jgi:hypothetical protein
LPGLPGGRDLSIVTSPFKTEQFSDTLFVKL